MAILMKVKNMEAPESNAKNWFWPYEPVIGVVGMVIGRVMVFIGSSQQGQMVTFSPGYTVGLYPNALEARCISAC